MREVKNVKCKLSNNYGICTARLKECSPGDETCEAVIRRFCMDDIMRSIDKAVQENHKMEDDMLSVAHEEKIRREKAAKGVNGA